MVQPLKACWNLQEEISPEMRKVLVEWLCDLCVEFKLEQETFFLMVSAARAPPLCPGTRPAIVSHSHATCSLHFRSTTWTDTWARSR